MMRVQFTVNQEEHEKLKELAKDYPDVSSYCKDAALNERTYGNMWQQVTDKIAAMKPSEETFALRDLVPTPPSNMGVKLYQNQEKLKIEFVKKDSSGVDTYKKIK